VGWKLCESSYQDSVAAWFFLSFGLYVDNGPHVYKHLEVVSRHLLLLAAKSFDTFSLLAFLQHNQERLLTKYF
jgi:predicted Kef-type K+ transport protein